MKDFDPRDIARNSVEYYERVEPERRGVITLDWIGRISERVADAVKGNPKIMGMMEMPADQTANGRDVRAHNERLSTITTTTLFDHPDEERRLVAKLAQEINRKLHDNKRLQEVYPYVMLYTMLGSEPEDGGAAFIHFGWRYGRVVNETPQIDAEAVAPYRPQSGDVLFFSSNGQAPHRALRDWSKHFSEAISVGLERPVIVAILPPGVEPVKMRQSETLRDWYENHAPKLPKVDYQPHGVVYDSPKTQECKPICPRCNQREGVYYNRNRDWVCDECAEPGKDYV